MVSKEILFIFALLINVVHAKEIFTKTKLSPHCNLPYGYVDKSLGRDFIFMKTIIVHSKKYGNKNCFVDDNLFDYLNQWNWSIHKGRGDCFYASRKLTSNKVSKYILMHRLILGAIDPKIFVDHKDRNGLNNQIDNIRIATPSQNCCNRLCAKNKTSIYKGVIRRGKKWRAQIKVLKRGVYIGQFNTELEAAIAYNNAAIKYHGEFAKLNNIKNG